MSVLAELAPEVESSLAADAAAAAAVPPALREAIAAAVAELRAEATWRDAAWREAAAGGSPAPGPALGPVLRPETAQLLRQFADHLEQPRAWYGIDRFVHELLSDLVRDALVVPHVPHGGNAGALTARAVALRVLARHEPLWPGAGSRGISPYSHESLLAVVRLAALAA